MSKCDNCGTNLRNGICTNCQEEMYIYDYQMDEKDRQCASASFMKKVEEQRSSTPKIDNNASVDKSK